MEEFIHWVLQKNTGLYISIMYIHLIMEVRLYTDEGSYGITMENNLVYSRKNSGFHQHYGMENIIRIIFLLSILYLSFRQPGLKSTDPFTNNIIYYDKGTLFHSNWNKFNLFSDYNCYWDTRSANIRFADKSFKGYSQVMMSIQLLNPML